MPAGFPHRDEFEREKPVKKAKDKRSVAARSIMELALKVQAAGLVISSSGNVSIRLSDEEFAITASGA